MDGCMVIVPLEFEVFFKPIFKERNGIIDIVYQKGDAYVANDCALLVYQSLTKDDYMRESVVKTIEFEVLVEYYEKDGKRIPLTATCQTDCPKFIAGYVEVKAMDQIKGHEMLMTHLTKETEAYGKSI